MSLAALNRRYGKGSRREVINRAIRAEIRGGAEVLDSLAALHGRMRAGSTPELEAAFSKRLTERDRLIREIEEKHGIKPRRAMAEAGK